VNKHLLKDAFGWGFALWLIGYAAGIALYPVVPTSVIGWFIMPFAVALTLWILWKKVSGASIQYYIIVGIVWAAIAVCDYAFLVKLFDPSDGYYKLDVYLYYTLTFVLPIAVGWVKLHARPHR
jgi:hypothetical protein